jgi:type IV fimbrial biogenesis protein FimT
MGHPARGLTLLELVIALAVLAVLGTLAVPSLGARLGRQRLAHAAQALAADIADARFEAARRGQVLYLETGAGAGWCWAVATSPACACGQIRGCQLHRVGAEVHPGIRLVEGEALQLDPTGTARPSPVATFESGGGERLRVDALALGRTRICSTDGANARFPRC